MGVSAPIKLSPPKLARMGEDVGEDLKSGEDCNTVPPFWKCLCRLPPPKNSTSPVRKHGEHTSSETPGSARQQTFSVVGPRHRRPAPQVKRPTNVACSRSGFRKHSYTPERRTSTNIRLPTDDNTRVSQKLLTNFAVSASGVGWTFGSGPQSTTRRCRHTCNRRGRNACLAVSRH